MKKGAGKKRKEISSQMKSSESVKDLLQNTDQSLNSSVFYTVKPLEDIIHETDWRFKPSKNHPKNKNTNKTTPLLPQKTTDISNQG